MIKEKTEDFDFKKMYIDWLYDNVEQYRISDSICRITLPFMDVNNDNTDIYIIRMENGRYRLSDDRATIDNLRLFGVDIDKNSRRGKVLNSIMDSFGVSLVDDELIVEGQLNEIPQKKHMLAQCIIKVSDLFYMSRKNVVSIFLEDVQSFFDRNDIRYIDNINVIGKSRLNAHYDFVIAKSQKAEERFVRVINNMDNNQAKNVIFAWNDTLETRRSGATLYAIIHDEGKKISYDALNALESYDIHTILWSRRDEYVSELAI